MTNTTEFHAPAPGLCRFCGQPRPAGYQVTCGRSECQEAAARRRVTEHTVAAYDRAEAALLEAVEALRVLPLAHKGRQRRGIVQAHQQRLDTLIELRHQLAQLRADYGL